ncbi:LppX_LprAFG lipoprotein [Amycolatopsis rhizosphaerae]|uniref:LppX_LprAFG lipoprotein n=1 Tax=Amycolatopsis rhizosphaerae TaxID=2053003 RepID=A0A558DCP8_9PSEU|nr:LppX_LprAFG lipoprotein [Amycolatopsis rhizosphaerae]TVT58815.1 LppX_LprAFG lipoprotein [Amycolatopsis rhizosphaerae]
MLRRRTASFLVLILALVSGCTASPDTRGPLPDATGLVTAAAGSFEQVRTLQFDFSVSSTIPGLDIREVKGQASREGGPYGSASGQADMQESTNRFEMNFQIVGDRLHLANQHGLRTDEPVPPQYRPVLLMGPDSGLPKLLKSATGLKTETKEDVKGVPTYRVTGQLAKDVVAEVLPAVQANVDVKFWVTQSEPRTLVRVWMQLPPRQPNEGAVMLELGLSAANQPVGTTGVG